MAVGTMKSPEYCLLRRIINRLAQIIELTKPERPFDHRASGDCICEMCGDDYYHHAHDPRDPTDTLLCDGRRVHL